MVIVETFPDVDVGLVADVRLFFLVFAFVVRVVRMMTFAWYLRYCIWP